MPAVSDRSPTKLQPVLNARAAGTASCYDRIKLFSERLIDTEHAGMSRWHPATPDDRIFFSSMALKYDKSRVAQQGHVLLSAAPHPGGCDMVAVQLLPLRASCSTVETNLAKEARRLGSWNGGALFEDKAEVRFNTMPLNANLCLLIVQHVALDPVPVSAGAVAR